MFDTVLKHMNRHGRVSLCGAISTYNINYPTPVKGMHNNNSYVSDPFLSCKHSLGKFIFYLGPYIHMEAISKELKFQGFMTGSFYARYEEGFNQLNKWIREVGSFINLFFLLTFFLRCTC